MTTTLQCIFVCLSVCRHIIISTCNHQIMYSLHVNSGCRLVSLYFRLRDARVKLNVQTFKCINIRPIPIRIQNETIVYTNMTAMTWSISLSRSSESKQARFCWWSVFDNMCRMGRRSFRHGFDINQSTYLIFTKICAKTICTFSFQVTLKVNF